MMLLTTDALKGFYIDSFKEPTLKLVPRLLGYRVTLNKPVVRGGYALVWCCRGLRME